MYENLGSKPKKLFNLKWLSLKAVIPAGPANRVRTLESPHQSPRRKLENPRMCPEYLINPRKYKNLKKVTNLILKVKKSQPNLKKAKNQTTKKNLKKVRNHQRLKSHRKLKKKLRSLKKLRRKLKRPKSLKKVKNLKNQTSQPRRVLWKVKNQLNLKNLSKVQNQLIQPRRRKLWNLNLVAPQLQRSN